MKLRDRLNQRRRPAPEGVAGKDAASYLEEAAADVQAGGPDVNPALTGRTKYQAYQEMRLSDSAVRSALWTVKLPIRGGAWDVEAASDDPVDTLIADAAAAQLGLRGNPGWLDLSWDAQTAQALLFLDWGCMFEEIVWAKDPVEWRDADGDPHLIRPAARLAPRFPATVSRVVADTQTGRIARVEQDLPGAHPIPGEKVIHLALEREGRNWWGTSLLRPMWGPWRLKKALMVGAGIAYDRWASGVPVVRYPAGGSGAVKAQAEQIGRNIRQHERAYVALEGPPPPAGGWDVSLLRGADAIADPVPLLNYFNRAIGEAAMQQFTSLGTTERGSRAVGDVLSDPFYQAAAAIAGYLAEERGRQLLRRWVDHNFGEGVDVPRLTVSKLQARSVETLARALAELADAGLNFTDRATQDDIRDQLELPHLPDDVGVEVTPAPWSSPAARRREGDPLELPGEAT